MAQASPKSTRSPAFQFYPKEFLSSSKVMAMSALERGAYITLLCVQWLDGSLPNDLPALARLTGIAKRQFLALWPANLGRCFVVRRGRLVNERLETERQKQAEYRQRQSENGSLGGRPSKPKPNPEKPDGSFPESQVEPKKSSPSAFASASAISDLQTAVTEHARTKPAPIVRRRNGRAAWEGARGLYVLADQHARFIEFRNHSGAEAELFAWYEQTAETFTGNIDPNMFRFWDARYVEHWPAASATKARSHEPEWLQRARAAKAAGAGE